MQLKSFVKISPGFKAAVNLENELDNLDKVAGFIPNEPAQEAIRDFGAKLHPTASGSRSRLITGTYGTGKSHLALVLANLYMRPIDTPEFHVVLEKVDPDIRKQVINTRNAISKPFLPVLLYGNVGRISDGLMMGLRNALDSISLSSLLPDSAFDAAIRRIEEVVTDYPESRKILESELAEAGRTVKELTSRLESYDRKTFDFFREIHPAFSGGSQFVYSTMLEPDKFYQSVVSELIEHHGYGGICVFWDEFGHKMEEVVKDPTGSEAEELQDFAECCNDSGESQLHLYLFCHRSLKEYQDVSRSAMLMGGGKEREEDLRKLEGRFAKPFHMKNSDVETFRLIDNVIIADTESDAWRSLLETFDSYFQALAETTSSFRYFPGFSREKLKETVIYGTYPLHPMAVYALPEISEKVAQNNRTLFTCLCDDQPGSFFRFLKGASLEMDAPRPPMFTSDMLWDYFSSDVRQHEATAPIARDFDKLLPRLDSENILEPRILKAVSIFQIINPSRFRITLEILAHALDIRDDDRSRFSDVLDKLADHRDENRVLMKMSDGAYRMAISTPTQSVKHKIEKLISDSNSPVHRPINYLNRIWNDLGIEESHDATEYWDEYGVRRSLIIKPVSQHQLTESLHLVTKHLGKGDFVDGLLLLALCDDTKQIETIREIAITELSDSSYQQVVLAVPKHPVECLGFVREHNALSHLLETEPHLYGPGAELRDEWELWENDITKQLKDGLEGLLNANNKMLDYYWAGREYSEISNRRQLKKRINEVMKTVFPDCPYIGDDKLALDVMSGHYGYRKDCRDISLKLAQKEAATILYSESASAPKHVINLLLKSNGILVKNQAGEPVIQRPDERDHRGAAAVWDVVTEILKKAKKRPQDMKTLVNRLRKPPYGLKCRVMPIFFAAAAHQDLSLGNISFEFHKSEKKIEKITSFDGETVEKVFITPDKYKLIYVDVSTEQNEVIKGLAQVFEVPLESGLRPLERVRRIGEHIAAWWRSMPGHAHRTNEVSEAADVFRTQMLNPLSQLDADMEKVLLTDLLHEVFDAEDKKAIRAASIKKVITPIRKELEGAVENLEKRVLAVFSAVFPTPEPDSEEADGLTDWYRALSQNKREFQFYGDAGILMEKCRGNSDPLDAAGRLEMARKLTGMELASWADDMVDKFHGKLESARNAVEAHKVVHPIPPPTLPRPDAGSFALSLSTNGFHDSRTFEIDGELSENGVTLENKLNADIDQIGRSLSDKQKMSVFYRFVSRHIFGRETP